MCQRQNDIVDTIKLQFYIPKSHTKDKKCKNEGKDAGYPERCTVVVGGVSRETISCACSGCRNGRHGRARVRRAVNVFQLRKDSR